MASTSSKQNMLDIFVISLLSILLALSALLKAVNIFAFSSETQLYLEAYMPSQFVTFHVETSIIVCSIELLAAFFITSRDFTLPGAVLSFFLLSFFLYLTAINIFIPSEYGSIESCGCFGEFIHFSPKASLIKTFFIWLLSFFVLIRSIRNNTYRNKAQTKKGYKQILILIILSIVPPIYSLLLFKHVCHGLYLIGYCCLCIMTIAYMGTTILRVKKIYH